MQALFREIRFAVRRLRLVAKFNDPTLAGKTGARIERARADIKP